MESHSTVKTLRNSGYQKEPTRIFDFACLPAIAALFMCKAQRGSPTWLPSPSVLGPKQGDHDFLPAIWKGPLYICLTTPHPSGQPLTQRVFCSAHSNEDVAFLHAAVKRGRVNLAAFGLPPTRMPPAVPAMSRGQVRAWAYDRDNPISAHIYLKTCRKDDPKAVLDTDPLPVIDDLTCWIS